MIDGIVVVVVVVLDDYGVTGRIGDGLMIDEGSLS